MTRTLIIPDIHNGYLTAEDIIRREGADRTVLLGDYFDSFGETEDDVNGTARWLASSLRMPGRTHLVGNHDLNYMTNNPRLRCSGFAGYKKFLIDRHAIPWEMLRPFCYVGDYLCTHAGLSRQFFEEHSKTSLEEFMGESYEEMWHIDEPGYKFRFLEAGVSRGGTTKNGGIVWCDYDEFRDIKDQRQIFGHTRGPAVRRSRSQDRRVAKQ